MAKKITLLILLFLISLSSIAQSQPQDIVEAYLQAWSEADYAKMYEYIHPDSQAYYPQESFENRHLQVTEAIVLVGMQYTLQSQKIQGESALVTYDMVFESSLFGEIEDMGRMMRLVNTSGGWKIAWSTMDIFNTLTDTATLSVQSLPSQRGTIYDRNGLYLAQDGGTTVSLYTARERIFDEDACNFLLGEVGRLSTLDLYSTFSQNNPETIFFLGEMHSDVYAQYSTQLDEICGVTVFTSTSPNRDYYGGNAMVHATGYIGPIPAEEVNTYLAEGYGEGDLIGLDGVEAAYQEYLGGKPERVIRIFEPGGTILRELAGNTGSQSIPVTLTIDRDIQMSTVQALSDAYNYAVTNWGSSGISVGGGAVVLDVKTGAILGLASYPMFNPYLFTPNTMTPNPGIALSELVTDPRRPLRNRATNEQFAPGSVFKVITAAAILDNDLIEPDDIFYCDLYWQGVEFGDTVEERSDWRIMDDLDAAGDVSPAEAIMTSCNPFFWQYGARLFNEVSPNEVVDYARMMGAGQTYGFDGALNEVAGSLPVPQSTDIAISEAIGQGNIALSPLHMAVVTMGIANDGVVYRPYILKQIGGVDGTEVIESNEPEILNTYELNPGVMETIKEGMCGVVTNEEFGTAWGRFHNWGPKGYVDITAQYTVCGKTGTAESVPYPNAWFIAYAPAEDPEIAVAVLVDRSLEGSQVSAPIVRRILDDYFNQPRAEFPRWWNTDTFIPLEFPDDTERSES